MFAQVLSDGIGSCNGGSILQSLGSRRTLSSETIPKDEMPRRQIGEARRSLTPCARAPPKRLRGRNPRGEISSRSIQYPSRVYPFNREIRCRHDAAVDLREQRSRSFQQRRWRGMGRQLEVFRVSPKQSQHALIEAHVHFHTNELEAFRERSLVVG